MNNDAEKINKKFSNKEGSVDWICCSRAWLEIKLGLKNVANILFKKDGKSEYVIENNKKRITNI